MRHHEAEEVSTVSHERTPSSEDDSQAEVDRQHTLLIPLQHSVDDLAFEGLEQNRHDDHVAVKGEGSAHSTPKPSAEVFCSICVFLCRSVEWTAS